MKPDSVIVLFMEGDTECEFYKALIDFLRKANGSRLSSFIECQVLKGVGNFCTKAERILQKDLMNRPKYRNLPFKVILCYDTDVFERNANKVCINWSTIEKAMHRIGISQVHHIKASSSIEDWFLADPDGIRDFLKISKSQNISKYKGLKGLQNLFVMSGRRYAKGIKCQGLVDLLDLRKILGIYCNQVQTLCQELGICCSKDGNCP